MMHFFRNFIASDFEVVLIVYQSIFFYTLSGFINVGYECPPDYNQHKFFLYFATFLILNSMQLKNKRNK